MIVGENDLQTVDPELAKEWNYEKNKELKPSDVTAKGNRKVWWRCKQSHEWMASISSRQRGNGCPYCSGRLAIEGETDLLSTHPQLADEWFFEKNDITPQNVKAGSNVKVWWQGKCGHVYEMKVSDRSRGSGGPYCAGKRVLVGFNDLQTTNPELSEEWFYEKNDQLTPLDVMPGSSKSAWWKCKEGHVWKAVIASRSRGSGCPYCSGRIAWKGHTDIITTNPEVAALWDYDKNKGIDIYSCVSGSEKEVYWRCPKGHSWKNMIKKQVKANVCPICSPDKKSRIYKWRADNPNGTKTQCSYETGISYPTVRKWW